MVSEEKLPKNDKPPVLGSWRNMYRLVLGALVLQIALYYGITKYFE